MENSPLTAAAAIAQVTEQISESLTVQGTLDAIVSAARTAVPEFAHVSISMREPGGTIETKAGTDQLVWELDAAQYRLGEGPCVQAMREESLVVVERLAQEQRWPRYVRAAAARGVRSQVGVRLAANGKHIGGLNLYSTEHDAVDEDSTETARIFATHAAIVLSHAQHESQLNQALDSRKIIGQAIGILMERYRIDSDRAFQFLLRASSTSNIKLREVADEVVVSSVEHYRRDAGD